MPAPEKIPKLKSGSIRFCTVLLVLCLVFWPNCSSLAQSAPSARRIPIEELFTGLGKGGYAQAAMLDANHLLVHAEPDCSVRTWHHSPPSYCQFEWFFVIDLSGRVLARTQLKLYQSMYALFDGYILLEEDQGLKVLDQTFHPIAEYPCAKLDCSDKLIFGRTGNLECLTGLPSSCHRLGSMAEIARGGLIRHGLTTADETTPLMQRVKSLSPSSVLEISENEVWFMDAKGRVFRLTAASRPERMDHWLPFAKENCAMTLSGGSDPRLLAACSVYLEIDFDDGIGLVDQTEVFDVPSHKLIAHRSTNSDSVDPELSPDGHTLICVYKTKYIELQPLP